MSSHFNRLRRGDRWWLAEIALRTVGFALLGAGYRLALIAHRMLSAPPPHEATVGEFAICAALVLAVMSGLALAIFGPGLFQEVQIPRGSRWYWKEF